MCAVKEGAAVNSRTGIFQDATKLVGNTPLVCRMIVRMDADYSASGWIGLMKIGCVLFRFC